MTRLTISRAAKAANVNVETIRFYERRGLIDQPLKPAGGGAREYDGHTISRIRFVREAQDLGFSLREIAELLALQANPGADCADVRARAAQKREEVEAKLGQLSGIRDALDELIAFCPGSGDVGACTILDAIERGAIAGPPATPTRSGQNPEGKAEMETVLLTVDGMHCDGCARTIEILLTRLPGVRKVEASFDKRSARVLYDPQTASEEAIAQAIAKGGFTAIVEQQ